jgi:peptidoglycan/xylan/chitin deacetylase (PgdA/CDA1 family)
MSRLRAPVAAGGKWASARIALALHAAMKQRGRTSSGVLMYHRVCPFPRGSTPTMAVRPERLREQLAGLQRRGWRFVSLRDIVRRLDEGLEPEAQTVAVTFDDGYAGVHTYALPILRELGVPATVLVATAYIDSTEPFPFDPWGSNVARARLDPASWRPLSWEQVGDLDTSGLVDVGTHTHTHADFRGRPDALRRDLATSLALLDEHLGSRARPFAFPFGDVRSGFATPTLADEARALGAWCALTTEIAAVDSATDPFAIGRIEAVGSDTPATLEAKLRGWYGWMNTGRAAFQRVARSKTRRSAAGGPPTHDKEAA